MNEAWRLVADGILSAKDMDAVMSEGLGMRYAFLGAFEAAHLNAEGKIFYYSANKINFVINFCKTNLAAKLSLDLVPHAIFFANKNRVNEICQYNKNRYLVK